MRNVWKGLVIGGLMGALVGAIMDALRRENLERMGNKARDLGDAAAERARHTGNIVADRVRESDLRERVTHVKERGEEFANGHR
jgi:hypothetical protein